MLGVLRALGAEAASRPTSAMLPFGSGGTGGPRSGSDTNSLDV